MHIIKNKGARNISDEYMTPSWLFARAQLRFGPHTVDAASTERNRLCDERLEDGLTEAWHGNVWCNPPYSQTVEWVRKAAEESERGVPSTLLVPFNGSGWFFGWVVGRASHVIHLPRVAFFHPLKGLLKSPGGPVCLVRFSGGTAPRMPMTFYYNWRAPK